MSPSPSPTPTDPTLALTQIQSPNPTPLNSLPPTSTPSPWTHEETVNLIQTYQEKWYSLNRGQLKASQWDDVAATIAARCGFPVPSKSGTQCRHKMEKLRKRFRAEKQKLADPPSSATSAASAAGYHSWIYFPLMDHLDRGIPVSPPSPPPPPPPPPRQQQQHAYYEQQDGRHFGGGDAAAEGYRGKRGYRLDDEEEEKGVMGDLAGEMRGFVERYVMVERKKMEVMRENERLRLEMENKRLHMILVSHQKTALLIANAFAASSSSSPSSFKKPKLSPHPHVL